MVLKRKKLLAVIVGLVLITASILVPLHQKKTAALTTDAPDYPGDFSRDTYFELSNTSNVSIDDTWIKVYYDTTGQKSINIDSADMCTYHEDTGYSNTVGTDSGVSGAGASGSHFTSYTVWHTTHSGSPPSFVENTGAQASGGTDVGTVYGDVNRSGSSCPTKTLKITVAAGDFNTMANKYVVIVKANLYYGIGTSNGHTGQNAFHVYGSGSYIVGLSSRGGAQDAGFEILGNQHAYANFTLRLAADCNIQSNTFKRLHIYDPDNGAAGIQPTEMYFKVYDETTGAYLSSGQYANAVNMHGDSTNGWKPNNISNADSYIDAQIQPRHKYQWRLYNIYDNNTVQLDQPIDSIYYKTLCQDGFTGFTVTPDATSAALTPDDENPTGVSFVGSVTIAKPGTVAPNNTVQNVCITRKYFLRHASGAADTALTPSPEYVNADGTTPTCATLATGVRNYPESRTLTAGTWKPGDSVCENITVSPAAGVADDTGKVTSITQASDVDETCAAIVNKPYLKAFGGGVSAGMAFTQAPLGGCDSNDLGAGEIRTYARYTSATDIRGSSAQYAAIAAEQILGGTTNGFFSSSTRSPGDYLIFANVDGRGASTVNFTSQWGGNFNNGGGRCLTDFFDSTSQYTRFATAPTNISASYPASTSIDSLSSGTQYIAQDPSGPVNLTITGGSIPNGKRVTIYVAGNVEITGDITYTQSGAYSSALSNIPYLTIIAQGNIFITNNVVNLSGLYIAQPDPNNFGGTGEIFTCEYSGTFAQVPAGERFNNCHGNDVANSDVSSCNGGFDGTGGAFTFGHGTSLAINGAFIAKRVHFDRTNGSLRCGKNPATAESYGVSPSAEKFYFSPELFLGQPLFRSKNGSSGNDFGQVDSYSVLPPIF